MAAGRYVMPACHQQFGGLSAFDGMPRACPEGGLTRALQTRDQDHGRVALQARLISLATPVGRVSRTILGLSSARASLPGTS